jgi:hypothetical protein
MGNHARIDVAPCPARHAGDCVTRKRSARATKRSGCLQHGHPCSEAGVSARATVRRSRLHDGPARSGAWFVARATGWRAEHHRERPVQRSRRRCFGQPERRGQLRGAGGPVQQGGASLGKPGGRAALVRGSAVRRASFQRLGNRASRRQPLCGLVKARCFIVRATGGGVASRPRAPRAMRSARSRGQPRGREGFIASGTMLGPFSLFGRPRSEASPADRETEIAGAYVRERSRWRARWRTVSSSGNRVSGRAHDKLITRATGWWERGHGKLIIRATG